MPFLIQSAMTTGAQPREFVRVVTPSSAHQPCGMLNPMNTPDPLDNSHEPSSTAPIDPPNEPLQAIPVGDLPPVAKPMGPPLRMENLVSERRPRVVLPVVLFLVLRKVVT